MAQIDIEKLAKLSAEADKIFLSPEGEKVLVQLLEIQAQVDDAITAAEQKLEAAALKINPNFNSIQADNIKVYYRAYGSKYYVDEEKINMAPKELYVAESKVTYKVDADAVDEWIEKNGGLPTGINEVERKKSLKFSLKKTK